MSTRMLNAIAHRKCHRRKNNRDKEEQDRVYLSNFEHLFNIRRMMSVDEFKSVQTHLKYVRKY